MDTKAIGQIGLGSLGCEFVPHLAKKFGTLTVFDRDAARVAPLLSNRVRGAKSSRDVGASSDIVLLSLPDPDAVRAVLLGPDGVLADGVRCKLIIDTTTGDPKTAREMAALAAARGIVYVEAPVSTPIAGAPGPVAARTGEATFLVGAEPGAFAAVESVLSCLGRHIFHVGPVGHGSAMKLVTNYIAGATRMAIAEGFALAASMGIPCARTAEICQKAAAASQTLEEVITTVIEGDLGKVGFSVDLRYKDFRLTSELGREMGVPMPIAAYCTEFYQMMRARGMGGMEMNNMVPFVGELAGVDIFNGGKKSPA
jgi:3-hydroxyisobutyrate dehydrogenase-like beta-hydroxyacid dehydrogenase